MQPRLRGEERRRRRWRRVGSARGGKGVRRRGRRWGAWRSRREELERRSRVPASPQRPPPVPPDSCPSILGLLAVPRVGWLWVRWERDERRKELALRECRGGLAQADLYRMGRQRRSSCASAGLAEDLVQPLGCGESQQRCQPFLELIVVARPSLPPPTFSSHTLALLESPLCTSCSPSGTLSSPTRLDAGRTRRLLTSLAPSQLPSPRITTLSLSPPNSLSPSPACPLHILCPSKSSSRSSPPLANTRDPGDDTRYAMLCTAALVCRTWASMTQRIPWRDVRLKDGRAAQAVVAAAASREGGTTAALELASDRG